MHRTHTATKEHLINPAAKIFRRMHEPKVSHLKNQYRKKVDELVTVREELQCISKITRALKSNMDPKKISSLITYLTCELMHTDACVLRLMDAEKKVLVVNAAHCVSDTFVRKISMLSPGECVCSEAAAHGRPVAIYDIDKNPRVGYAETIKKEGFKSMLSVPILFQSRVSGVISTYSKKKRHFTSEEIEILSIFASQAAAAIQETTFCDDLHMNYFSTIRALVLAVEAKDPYMRGHTERVTEYAVAVGKNLDMSNEELETLRYASELHDLGKISIPDFVLGKPGKLTCAERAIIELHPVKGTELLEPLDFLKDAVPIVRHHHERYDGTGYPDRLNKDNIPFMSRIIACADSYDAMTSDRPYRMGRMSHDEALQEILHNAGTQFDPQIASVFALTMKEYKKEQAS